MVFLYLMMGSLLKFKNNSWQLALMVMTIPLSAAISKDGEQLHLKFAIRALADAACSADLNQELKL